MVALLCFFLTLFAAQVPTVKLKQIERALHGTGECV